MSGRPPRRTLAELRRDHAHAQHPIDAENAALARDQTDLAIRRVDEADRSNNGLCPLRLFSTRDVVFTELCVQRTHHFDPGGLSFLSWR